MSFLCILEALFAFLSGFMLCLVLRLWHREKPPAAAEKPRNEEQERLARQWDNLMNYTGENQYED